jgi:type III pantothenate kinase
MTILAIDIGNSHTVFGIFTSNRFLGERRVPTSALQTESKRANELARAARKFHSSRTPIDGIVISSVVPKLTKSVAVTARKCFHKKPLIVSADLDLGIDIHYTKPRDLGADRICNAIAAYEKFGGPIIIVDLGTATTFEVISRKGDFLGGVIAPGIGTMATSLHHRTAKLPAVPLRFPRNVIGTTTIENIQSGILYGAVDAMEGILQRIKKHLGAKSVVVATGGFSKLISAHSAMIDYVEPTLVLEGARLIYERVRAKKKRVRKTSKR